MRSEPAVSHQPIGPYLIEHRLATGGMAEVFVAKRMGPHGFFKRVALKRILPQFSKDSDFVSMFIEEARLAARLDHPNIVQVFDFGELDGDLFLAMELVHGSNANRLLRAVTAHGETVPLDVALHIVSETAHGLASAHRAVDDEGRPLGIVHRDVSPANLLLTRTGHVKLSDFGIARVAAHAQRTDDGHVRGKLGYMSPEQVLARELDGRSDVFTLATVFAEMLLGEPLFGRGNDLDVLLRIRDADLTVLDTTDRRLPQDIRKLLALGLARQPEDRPTAAAFAQACDEVLRRRGLGYGPDRVARLLMRLELVRSEPGVEETEKDPAGRVTSFVDTRGLSGATAKLVGELGLTSPAIYRVQLANGEIVGPLSYPRLVQLITSGSVLSSTAIAKAEGEFLPAESLPELTRYVSSPALQWKLDELRRAEVTGPIGPGQLLPIVHGIATRQKTGVLHLHEAGRRKKIYFVDGRPEFVASTDKNELLGEYLVQTGVCLRMEVEMALALLPRYGGRLGDALVGLGVLRPVELFRAIQSQVRSRYLEAFRWTSGEWAFVDRERSGEEVFPLGHDVNELMRDAVMEADAEELEAALLPIRGKILSKAPSPPAPLSSYRVPDSWHRLYEGLHGGSTLGSLIASESELGGLGAEEVCRALYLGLSCELVTAA